MAGKSGRELFDSAPDAPGEAGHAGSDPYGPERQAEDAAANAKPIKRRGNVVDFAKTWANKAALGAGPQLEGALAATLQAAANANAADIQRRGGEKPFAHLELDPLEAYRDVRNAGKREHAASEDSEMGELGGAVGNITTPLPIKGPGAGATFSQRLAHGAKTGGAVGFTSGLAQSDADLTRLDSGDAKQAIVDALIGLGGGVVAGGTLGGASRLPASVGDDSREVAKKLALGSLGMTPSQRGQLAKLGKTEAAAEMLLGDGLDSKPVLGWSRGGTAQKTAAELGEAGSELGALRKSIDTASGGKSIDPERIAEVLEAEAAKLGGTPEAEAISADLMNRAAIARKYKSGQLIPLEEAEAVFKTPLNEFARKAKTATGEPPAASAAREIARDSTAKYNEEQAERLASLLAPEQASKYGPAKQRYATAKELARILQKSEPEAFSKSPDLDPLELPNIELIGGGGADGITGGARTLIGKALGGAMLPAAARGLNRFGRFLRETPTGGVVGGLGGSSKARSALDPYLDLLNEKPEEKP